MGRIVSLILFVGCIFVGCEGASEKPTQSDDFAAQSGQIIHHLPSLLIFYPDTSYSTFQK